MRKVIQSFDEAPPYNPRSHSRTVQGKVWLQEGYFPGSKILGSRSPQDDAGHEVVGETQEGTQGRVIGRDVKLKMPGRTPSSQGIRPHLFFAHETFFKLQFRDAQEHEKAMCGRFAGIPVRLFHLGLFSQTRRIPGRFPLLPHAPRIAPAPLPMRLGRESYGWTCRWYYPTKSGEYNLLHDNVLQFSLSLTKINNV